MLRSPIHILAAAAVLFVSAPAFAADEVDCILAKFSPAQREALALKSYADLVGDGEIDEGQGAERDAAIAYGRYSDECETKNDWNKDQSDTAGDYTLLALAGEGLRIRLKRDGVPVEAIDNYYADRPRLKGMDVPMSHVGPGPHTDAWSTALIADLRKSGIALPGKTAELVPTYIALLAWRDQRRAEFKD